MKILYNVIGGWLTGKFEREKGPTENSRVHYSTEQKKGFMQSHPDWEAYANDEQVG